MEEIADCGFYPHLVSQALAGAVGRRGIRSYVVHHEATFSGHEVHRHITVLVLLEDALIICHADEGEHGRAIVTTELVRLTSIDSVMLTQSVADPAAKSPGLAEAWLTVIWGATRRLEVAPASCDDPTCDADHGYTGIAAADDYVLRMSRDADGSANTGKLVEFGTLLQGAVA
ncbi:MAG: phosphodiesterase [Propionibacterium sp.]|nr:phosphodiesterase [Propionibacterium sp.]